jgi:hypothetical protein
MVQDCAKSWSQDFCEFIPAVSLPSLQHRAGCGAGARAAYGGEG